MPLGKSIRELGMGGITKQELNTITKDSGKSSSQVIQKLDQINQNLKQNDKAGIGLGAAASNMLIRQASKQSPTGYDAYMSNIMGPAMGIGRLGTELQRRATEFGTDRTNRNMSALVSGGQYMMPGGRTANLGFGKQFELPKTTIKNPIGGEGYKPSMAKPGTAETTTTEEEIPTTKEELPLTPEGMAAASTGSMSDPFFATNSPFWKRNQGRGKRKGNKSTIANSRARTNPSSPNLGV